MEREARREDKEWPLRPRPGRTLVANGTRGYRRVAVRIGLSGRALQLPSILLALVSSSVAAVKADGAADLRDVLDAVRRELDRAIHDLETVRKERDKALALVRRLRLPSNEDPASSTTSTAPSAEELRQIWVAFDDLEKRAAATDERIEKRKEETAQTIERINRIQRRLLRYC
jgi:hypothetical protein